MCTSRGDTLGMYTCIQGDSCHTHPHCAASIRYSLFAVAASGDCAAQSDVYWMQHCKRVDGVVLVLDPSVTDTTASNEVSTPMGGCDPHAPVVVQHICDYP